MNVTIVGLGLIGSSMAWQLQQAGIRVTGYARKDETIRKAEDYKIVAHGFTDLARAVRDADLVVISLPAEIVPETVQKIDRLLKQKTLVIDVGSVKQCVMDEVEKLTLKKAVFVGAHPMAGSEKVGIDHFVKNLFKNRPFVFTYPSAGVKKQYEPVLKDLCRTLRANYLELTAAEHDARVAAISHLPYFAAVSVYNRFLKSSKQLSGLASTGFGDVTRVAHSDPLWGLMVAGLNRKNVMAEIDGMIGQLTALKKDINKKDWDSLLKRLNVDQVTIDPSKKKLVKKQITEYH